VFPALGTPPGLDDALFPPAGPSGDPETLRIADGLGAWPPPELARFHERAREWLTALIDGREVEPAPHDLPPAPAWRLDANGVLREEPRTTRASDYLLADFVALMRWRPFPFRRCARGECGRFFVPAKRPQQKFCSPECMYRALEAGRREEHRAYMRERRKRDAAKTRRVRR
jgi:hypothetical protein